MVIQKPLVIDQAHISSPSDLCKEFQHLLVLWDLPLTSDVTSRTFQFLFLQGLLEQCSPTEYSQAWFMQAASNSIGMSISQFHPLSIVDSPTSTTYFKDACLMYSPALERTSPLPSCDLIMCQYSSSGSVPLSPVELYAMDEYHMNHWSLLLKISPCISLGAFPLEESKCLKVSLPVDATFSGHSVVEQDQESSIGGELSLNFGMLDGFVDQEQVHFSKTWVV